MEINPKCQIGQLVHFGPHKGKVIGIMIKPNDSLTYQISYWNENGVNCIETYYDFEIEPTEKVGFRPK